MRKLCFIVGKALTYYRARDIIKILQKIPTFKGDCGYEKKNQYRSFAHFDIRLFFARICIL